MGLCALLTAVNRQPNFKCCKVFRTWVVLIHDGSDPGVMFVSHACNTFRTWGSVISVGGEL